MDLYSVFGFLFLCGLGLNSYAADDCLKVLEGSSYTIELNSAEQSGDTLIWKKDGADIVYQRRKETVTGKGTVNNKGDLVLNNLTSSMNGTYKAEHVRRDGIQIKTTTKKLCVIPKAPVPKLNVKCSSLGEATLTCEYKAAQGFTLSWFNNRKEMSSKSNPMKLKAGSTGKYRCRLTNDQLKTDKEESNEETPSCSDDTLFGFNKWIMYGIIGGGGFLLLVLIILLIVLSCKSHRRRKRRQRDVEELRLQNMQYIGSMPRRPKHSALGQPVPPTPDEQGYLNAPEPGDPGFGNGIGTGPGGNMEFDHGGGVTPVEPQTQTQTQPRRQARPRAPPPPAEEDEEVAPPLPQPRRTGHQRPRP